MFIVRSIVSKLVDGFNHGYEVGVRDIAFDDVSRDSDQKSLFRWCGHSPVGTGLNERLHGETIAEPGCRGQDERRGVHRAAQGGLDRPVDAATGLDAWERNRPSPPRALIRSRKPSPARCRSGGMGHRSKARRPYPQAQAAPVNQSPSGDGSLTIDCSGGPSKLTADFLALKIVANVGVCGRSWCGGSFWGCSIRREDESVLGWIEVLGVAGDEA